MQGSMNRADIYGMFEKISYFFFKRRLKKKLRELYQMGDPWGGEFLSGIFSPLIREHMKSLPPGILASPVLDAGGGEAPYYCHLADLITEYHLVDTSAAALERAANAVQGSRVKLILKSLDEFRPAPGLYGTLWLIGILTYLGGMKHPKMLRTILGRLWKSLKSGGMAFLIHPYYSAEELGFLTQCSGYFIEWGGSPVYKESRVIGKQQFLIEIILKN